MPITASTTPLTTALAGQYWQVGDFEMQVRDVRGGDGVYSGWGVMSVPYLGLQLPVKFDQVWVDEDYQVVRGEVLALSEGVEGFRERWQQEHPATDAPDDSEEEVPVADGSDEHDASQEIPVATITIEGEVREVYVNEQGQVVAVDPQGNEEVVAKEVPEDGEVLAVQDSEGNSFTVDSQGNVNSGGGNSTANNDAPVASITEELIKEVLQHYEEEINFWLENHGKGPLDKKIVLRMLTLPDCLSGDEEELQRVLDRLDYFSEHRDELIALIEADEANRDRFHFLVDKLHGKSPPYQTELAEQEWDELIDIVCPHLLSEQVEENPVSDLIYDYFVTDKDAWYREEEAPYKTIPPKPRTNILAKSTQVAVLEVVQDAKGKPVAKIKLKDTGELACTSLSNLTQVKEFSKERKYTFLKEHTALKIPFLGNATNETYKKEAEITADKHFGNYLKVKGYDYWVEKSSVIWTDELSTATIIAETQNATEVGTKYTGNKTSVACNVCVRSALLLLREDQVLFPLEGSAYYDPADGFKKSYIKGSITNPGRAKNIKEDFDAISSKFDLNVRFTEIEKNASEGWEAYFKRLQDKADQGGIVIGVMLSSSGSSGHVMMITPGGLVDITKEGDEAPEPEWGNSFTKRQIFEVPRVLECGSGARENEAPLCRNVDHKGATNRLKWFEYKK